MNYPYKMPRYPPRDILVSLVEAIYRRYRSHRDPLPDSLQTEFLFVEWAKAHGEEEQFGLIARIVALLYLLHLEQDVELDASLTEARRLLLAGGLRILRADYTDDLV